jgi:WD40 repeat protein
MAVSTTTNEIHVFGQYNVEVVFLLKSTAPITSLHFIKGVYLVAIAESSGSITVLSLHSKTILLTYLAPGVTTACDSNYSLDWLILGLQNGQTVFYDVDRLNMTPFKLDNLQKRVLPKQKLSPVTSIQLNPRDIGTVLITYSHMAVIYSIVGAEIKQSFVYLLNKQCKGFELANHVANGGKKKLFGSSSEIIPQVIKAQWHPNGLHIATLHVDGSIVFWDAASGTLLEARNLFVTGLHQPGTSISPETNPFAPITDIRWVCAEDPEITQLLVSGGDANKPNAITVLDFGYTLKYTLTSNEKQGQFYAKPPTGQRRIQFAFDESKASDNGEEFITSILPIPASDLCYFNGNHNPQFLLLQSNFKSIYIVPYSATNQPVFDIGDTLFPPSLSMVLPPVSFSNVKMVQRIHWYSILSSRKSTGASAKTKLFVQGGAPANQNSTPKPIGAIHEARSILITGHEGGIVRLGDVTKGDNATPESIVQINMKGVLFDRNNPLSIKIKFVSVSFENREMIVALVNGEVVILKFGKLKPNSRNDDFSKVDYKTCPVQHSNGDAKIIDIYDRVNGLLASTSTFLPVSLLQLETPESISCIKMSNVGFAAIGFKSGRLVVCDITRGPAIIFNCKSVSEFLVSIQGKCYATSLEFSIMEYDQEGYSSLMLLVGTNCGGNLVQFKIVPLPNGAFEVQFANKTTRLNYRSNDDPETSKINQILSVNCVDGTPTTANLEMFNKLSQGVVIPSYTVVASSRDLRVLKLAKNKLSHSVIDEECLSCGVVNIQNQGVVLALLTKTGFVKFCSLPGLQDIANIKIPSEVYGLVEKSLTSGIAANSDFLFSGSVFVKTGTSEFVNLTVHSKEHKMFSKTPETDLLFNDNAVIPPRPVASALLWAKGQATFVTPNDLAGLIAGPNRKAPKHRESEMAYNLTPEANPNQAYGSNKYTTKDRGYKEPVRSGGVAGNTGFGAQGFMGNIQRGLDYVEESFNGYATQVSDAVGQSVESQKKDFYSAALKSKMGF